jgi:hypothetical protein
MCTDCGLVIHDDVEAPLSPDEDDSGGQETTWVGSHTVTVACEFLYDIVAAKSKYDLDLVTEIKTTTSFKNLDGPKLHHEAQTHVGAPFEDLAPSGFLPLTGYPRAHVEAYLDAYPDEKLTPTLAETYPDLAAEHGVYNWHCQACSATIPYEQTGWDGTVSNPPQCPECGSNGIPVSIRGPSTEQQQLLERTDEGVPQ